MSLLQLFAFSPVMAWTFPVYWDIMDFARGTSSGCPGKLALWSKTVVEGDTAVKQILRPFFMLLIMASLVVAGCGNSAEQGSADAENPERSEEHTSELQSRENLVCRLLLEK